MTGPDAPDEKGSAIHKQFNIAGGDQYSSQGGSQNILNFSMQAPPATPGVLESAGPHPCQLPPDIADFTGRNAELDDLRGRIPLSDETSPKAITISAVDGKAGIGKSALVIHMAHQLAPYFPDGQLYVDLRGAEPEPLSPSQALDQFLRSFEVADEDRPVDLEGRTAQYRTLLADRRMIVILDNAANATQVRPLLPGGAGCLVMITSRAQLADLDGVSPLTLDLMSDADAIALLQRFAGQDRVDSDPAAARAVVRYCGLLPLAVRIAGARLRARPNWSVAVLAERLADKRRRLLELKIGDLEVRSSFLLSYQGLTDEQSRAFRHLGLFNGLDITTAAAGALIDRPSDTAEAVLEDLVDAQLLETRVPGRYQFHDLIRLVAYAQAQAEEDEAERHRALKRLLTWYLNMAEQADELLKPTNLRDTKARSGFKDRKMAMDWLDAELANLVAAAQYAVEQDSPPEIAPIAWKLSGALYRFFYLRMPWLEWQAITEAALQAAQRMGDRNAEAQAVNHLGVIFTEQGRIDAAIAQYLRCLELYHQVGDRRGEGSVLNNLGLTYLAQKRLDPAVEYLERSVHIMRAHGSRHDEEFALNNLGEAYRQQGHTEKAITCFELALDLCRELEDRRGEAIVMINLGEVNRDVGQFDKAMTCLRESLEMCREVGDRHMEALSLRGLGSVTEALEGRQAAIMYWERALEIFDDLGTPEASEVRALLENGPHPVVRGPASANQPVTKGLGCRG